MKSTTPWWVPFHGECVPSETVQRIRARTEKAPPLTAEQKDLLRVLFKPPPHGGQPRFGHDQHGSLKEWT
jgi:hypothetical protein